MPLLAPIYTEVRESNFDETALDDSLWTNVVASATANTKGSWTELIASTTHDAYGFWLNINGTRTASTRTATLMDVGIGAAASEVVLVPDLLAGFQHVNTLNMYGAFYPVFIPKGSRVAVRTQSVVSSQSAYVAIVLQTGLSLPSPVFSGCDAYGVVSSADSTGTDVTPGSDSWGSWTSIPASTTTSRAYKSVLLLTHSEDDTAFATDTFMFDVGYGSASLGYNVLFSTLTTEYINGPFPNMPYNTGIPSGTQLQVRASKGNGTAPQSVALYCFY